MDTEVQRILSRIQSELETKRMSFADILDMFPKEDYRAVLLAWGQLREQGKLKREANGDYYCESGG